jgi:Holliday junction resolvasome RuvABC endonuclease subunit
MIVLGVDPGYTNLGLSVVELDRAGGLTSLRRVLHSENMEVGQATRPLRFAGNLATKLQSLHENYGPIEAIGMESPTYIQSQIRTTALLWHVVGILLGWAETRDIPYRSRTPMELKRVVSDVLELRWDRRNPPSKKLVIRGMATLLGCPSRELESSHEADSILAAFACWGMLGAQHDAAAA